MRPKFLFQLMFYVITAILVQQGFSSVAHVGHGQYNALFSNNNRTKVHTLLKRTAASGPVNLKINVMYVEFQEEKDDNDRTTGRGVFNSGKDTFNLDPRGFRKHKYYLERHLEFAQHYFNSISNGRLKLTWRFFPEPDAETGEIKEPFQLRNRMAAYNPTRKETEKREVFFKNKAIALMSFVSESIRRANADKDENDNPFRQPFSPDTIDCYMIFHAGYNGLLDGGKLGKLGADTPHDIIDFFATKEDFSLLKEFPETQSPSLVDVQNADSIGVIVGESATRDTIQEVMILSESASQDDVNFGINGILVNQIARQIGMPDTWDRGTGFTQLGYFDMMDVGHLSQMGFIPVYPSAWIRMFMGWENPSEARPGKDGKQTYDLYAPTFNHSDNSLLRSVKIPINDREYLLVENRQKSLFKEVTIYYSYSQKDKFRFDIKDSLKVSVDFLDSLFLDSLCDIKGKNCKVNEKRPRGIITGVSDYDIGIPGSGLLVWHVNEWFVEEAIKYGFVNASDDDTKEFVGINLVEADGDLSIGKEGKDQLNQSVFDFGTGADVLPHIAKQVDKVEGKDTTWKIDTIRYITPYGHANTNSWNDGRSHIVLEAPTPTNYSRLLPGINPISGDSIFNYLDTSLTLVVHWNSNKIIGKTELGQWPIRTLRSTAPTALTFTGVEDRLIALLVSDEGYLQAYGSSGKMITEPFDTLFASEPFDSLHTLTPTGDYRDSIPLPVASLGAALGTPISSAVLANGKNVFISDDGNVHITGLSPDSFSVSNAAAFERVTKDVDAVIGPLVVENQLWIVDKNNKLLLMDDNAQELLSVSLPDIHYHHLAAYRSTKSGNMEPVLVGRGGRTVIVDVSAKKAEELTEKEGWTDLSQTFSISTSDFDRDGDCDILLLGSRGAMAIINQSGEVFPNFPQQTPRFTKAVFEDSVEKEGKKVLKTEELLTQDLSHPAIADINEDGYPDILFTGVNTLYAMDYTGAVLSGWPFQLERRQNVGQLYHSKTIQATVVQSQPLVAQLDGETVIIIASPDGLIWAVTNEGEPYSKSAFDKNSEIYEKSGPLSVNRSDWPLSVGGLNYDTTDVPFINLSMADVNNDENLELFAVSGIGTVDMWLLSGAKAADEANWTMMGGSTARQYYFDASKLQDIQSSESENKIIEFHLFPSPLKGRFANVHLNLGASADRAHIRVFDLAGMVVKDSEFSDFPYRGKQPNFRLDLGHLGPDVYTVRIDVKFKNGKTKTKWERIGVIR